ncbi:MAG: hypothetical protein MJ072_06930, partial [Clostridia bacterium]|nr:hypothetical protein [Clostridia bacterium]
LDSPLALEKSDSFVSAVARGIVIDKKGIGEFAIEVVSGEIGFMKFNLASHTDVEGLTIDYSKSDSSLVRFTTNSFSVKNGVLSNTGAFAKRTYGDSSWGDYTVEADITFTQNINGGIIF